jgi:hypothetical protein
MKFSLYVVRNICLYFWSGGEQNFYPSESDFGRVASFDVNDSSAVYTSPYTTGKYSTNIG